MEPPSLGARTCFDLSFRNTRRWALGRVKSAACSACSSPAPSQVHLDSPGCFGWDLLVSRTGVRKPDSSSQLPSCLEAVMDTIRRCHVLPAVSRTGETLQPQRNSDRVMFHFLEAGLA